MLLRELDCIDDAQEMNSIEYGSLAGGPLINSVDGLLQDTSTNTLFHLW